MPKRRKSSSSRKSSRSVRRWSIELIVLCLLLVVAAYVGHDDKAKPSRPVQTTEKVEKRSSTIKTEKKQEAKPAAKQAQQEAKKAQPEKKAAPKTAAEQKKTEAKKDIASKASPSPAPTAQEYQLVYAADGDSFEVQDSRKRKLRVRLYGVDAPEGKQTYGKESRAHLIKLMQGKKVIIKTMYQDDYKRSVALVYLSVNGKPDELSINQRQVQAGMAWVYDYYCTNAICNTWKLEEAMAQKEKLGLWKDRSPTPPWQWRRNNSR